VAEPPKPQIVNPPNSLREKVSGSGPISEAMLKKAEQAVASLAAQFDALLESEIGKLTELTATAVKEPGRRMDIVKLIFEIAHDLRGQAGTFNYPLITRVGSSLCHFAEGLEKCAERELEVIRLHIEAMQALLASTRQGEGGPVGEAIADGLEKAVSKVLA